MTTLIAFNPSNTAAPPLQAIFTLDGQSYAGAVTWNLAGQRWYLTLTDSYGNLTWSGALVGSPLSADIPLAPGIFTTSTLLYREDSGNFEVTP
jgi:hypothetical protein